MGTTLTGTTPQDTYDSLIKVTDNGPLSGSLKKLTDGLGNDSSLSLSTTAASLSGTLAVTGNATFDTTTLVVDAAGDRVIMGAASALQGDSLEVHAKTNAGAISLFGRASDNLSIISFRANGAATQKAEINGSDAGLGFVTGTTQRVLIDSTGNVGIGTSTPSGKLHVAGGDIFVGASYGLKFSSASYMTPENNVSGAEISTAGVFVLKTGIFPTERIRVDADGLKFNGDTAAANALDDYEEGTWTMGVSFGGASAGVTTSSNTGTYTKIGRQVTVNGYLILTSKGSSTGSAAITGLPFTISNGNQFFSGASLWFNGITFTNQFQGYGLPNTTTMDLREITILGVDSAITDADFANSSQIIVSLTYFV
jgi:hypothetical protein